MDRNPEIACIDWCQMSLLNQYQKKQQHIVLKKQLKSFWREINNILSCIISTGILDSTSVDLNHFNKLKETYLCYI